MQRMNVKTASAAVVVGWAGVCAAQTITSEYGIEFCSVGAVGNAPIERPPFTSGWATSPVVGRGSVNYEYRIGRTEITTAQYLEFANFAYALPESQRPSQIRISGPAIWGAGYDTSYSGPGRKFRLGNIPTAANIAVYGISWYEAAIFCNWLHNGKSTDPAMLLTGAYAVSTWGYNNNGLLTDDPNRLPGARYWIPSMDEQLKAFHYDPNRNGPGQGGYWLNKNGRDVPSVPGLPGVGQTSAEYNPGFPFIPESIPLMAYPDQLSPWGLLDTSGGTTEWNERVAPNLEQFRARGLAGASVGGSTTGDEIFGTSGISPESGGTQYGFRIATSIPNPSICTIAAVGFGVRCARRRRV